MIELVKSQVVFDEIEHTYTLDGKQLSGITSIIHKYVFPDMYAGVSEKTLAKKAEYGSLVHSQLQMWADGMPYAENTPEATACMKLFDEQSIKPLCSEYLVSDNEFVASSIDMVDDQLNLYDYKTTATLNMEYLRWQLSIYANLFELQNPGVQVGKLFVVHLKGDKAECIEVPRLIASTVFALLDCYKSGCEVFDNPRNHADEDERTTMETYFAADKELSELMVRVKELEDIKNTCLQHLEERMVAQGDEDFVRDTYKVHYTKPTTCKTATFDKDKLMAEHPDIDYTPYIGEKITNRKGSIKVTLKE